MDVHELRRLPLFAGTDDDQLLALLAAGTEVAFRPGEVLLRAGQPMEDWWVLLEGRIDLVRRTRQEDVVIRTMDTPGQWVGAVGAWDPQAVYFMSGRAASAGRVLRIPVRALRTLSSAQFPLGDRLLDGVVTTLRRVESAISDKESVIGLGTLAAGLAHELNNPAAAVTRAVTALGTDTDAMLSAVQRLVAGSAAAEQLQALAALRCALDPGRPADPVGTADVEESLSAWLSEHGVQRPWRLAPLLARSGADVAWCERVAEVLGDALEAGLEWTVSVLSVARSLEEAKESAGRISALVDAVKSYSQMDRASLQPVDVAGGLDSTLAVLAHRIPAAVSVVRVDDPDLPRIEAAGAELNQVWTHLVENALDAMGAGGTLHVTTRAQADGGVLVEIGDTGPGMSPDVLRHAFDPFFTTKGVGGTGLGLDIARRIVERHGGDIGIESRPGRTVVRVHLRPRPPVRPQERGPASPVGG